MAECFIFNKNHCNYYNYNSYNNSKNLLILHLMPPLNILYYYSHHKLFH